MAARELRQHAGRQLGQLAGRVALDNRQVLQPGAAQFDLAVAGEGIAGQHQSGAGHRGDARIAMNCDHDLVAPILDQSAGQKFFLRTWPLRGRRGKPDGRPPARVPRASILGAAACVATELQDAIRVQVVLLDLQRCPGARSGPLWCCIRRNEWDCDCPCRVRPCRAPGRPGMAAGFVSPGSGARRRARARASCAVGPRPQRHGAHRVRFSA